MPNSDGEGKTAGERPLFVADPLPGWRAEAADIYSSLREGECISLNNNFWNESPLAPTSRGEFIEQELRMLAARDGYKLDCDWYASDGLCCDFKLQEMEETPATEGDG